MDIALMFSGFSGLLAAFVASALWATRPTPLSSDKLSPDDEITTRLPRLRSS
jgi:hypothetical protein